MGLETMGWISVIPAIIAIVLSFVTRNTIISLLAACLVGTLAAGQGVMGPPTLIKTAVGTTDFSWVMLLNLYIAIIVAFFHKTGAIQAFSNWVHSKNLSRKGVQLMAWALGIFVYFSDSFSPLFVGTVMRDISDRAKISAEDGFLRRGLTTYNGYLTHEETSGIQGRPWIRPEVILGIEGEDLDPAPRATQTRSDNFYS